MTMRRVLGSTRQDELLNYLRTFRTGHVAELSQILGASPSTIRRDLDELQERGLVERVHGGAQITTIGIEAGPAMRARNHPAEKRRIGEAAARLIEPGTTILISGGTTTEHMLPFLGGVRDVTIITNGVQIAAGLCDHPDISVIVLGGELRGESMSVLGPMVTSMVQNFSVDLLFMGAFGVDPAEGVTGANLAETETDRALLGVTRRLVVLADTSKLTQRGPVRLAPTASVDTLVIDDAIDPSAVDRFRAAGVEVITC
ncbi:MAG: DeoR/GlpR family DNA-binding transcription regulator [Nocardioidaceae bacterium]